MLHCHAPESPIPTPGLSDSTFERIRQLAFRHAGLSLKSTKRSTVEARLGKTLRVRGLASFEEYCDLVSRDSTGFARAELVDVLTTHFTSFMRESSHFEFLASQARRLADNAGRVRVWSAASSTGEEPYSMLFTLLDALGPEADVRVLATDVSLRSVASVESGVYPSSRVRDLPTHWRRKYFLGGAGQWAGFHRVRREFRERVTCRPFNLLTSPLPARNFPIIFCRNVLIYFDRPTQEFVLDRLTNRLVAGGHLVLGLTEGLAAGPRGLHYRTPSIYQWAGRGARHVPR